MLVKRNQIPDIEASLQAAGFLNPPRDTDPDMFHLLAWDVGYERGRWSTPAEEEEEEAVEEEVVEEPVVKEEEDRSEKTWMTEQGDAYDNIFGFGIEDMREKEDAQKEVGWSKERGAKRGARRRAKWKFDDTSTGLRKRQRGFELLYNAQ